MNSLKSLITVAILGAVGVGLYMRINSMPDPKPPKEFSSSWVEPPAIDLGADMAAPFAEVPDVPTTTSSPSSGGSAPAFNATPPGGTAPVYVPPSNGGSAPPIASSGHDSVPVSADVDLPSAADLSSNNSHSGTTDPFSTHITGGPAGPNNFDAGSHLDSQSPAHTEIPNGASDLGAHTSTGSSDSLFYRTEHQVFEDAWVEARSMLSQHNLSGALLLLSPWYNDATLRPAEQEALLDLLSGLAGTVIYSPEHHLEPPYNPAPGETLEQIARRYQISAELLAKINGLAVNQPLAPGRPLKVLRGPFGAQIDPARHEMVLILGGRYAGRFEVGLGRERSEIEGRYEVRRKVEHPPYFGPDRTIEPGDPANPLGSHFLSLIKPLENEVAAPFGIHGTNAQGSLQNDEARGYVRLSERDITDCYDILTEKSPVLIRR